jgi:hypothetical protein
MSITALLAARAALARARAILSGGGSRSKRSKLVVIDSSAV